jgi:nucleoside-diphosphate-sugar epimerase
MKSRILVLGATGFIGRRITTALAGSDWATPVAASRTITSRHTDGVEHLKLDATDPIALRHALSGVTAVVNCIAGNAQTIVSSARALFTASAAMTAVPRIVHLSSLAVYGSATGDVDETSPLGKDLDSYGAAKLEAERLAASHPAVVMLRPGIVYGPESPWWSDRIARLLVARRLGDLGADGDGVCNLVFVEDVAQAVLRAIQLPKLEGRCFNLSLPQPPTWNEYFLHYAKALGAVPVRRISRRRLWAEINLLAPPLKLFELAAAKRSSYAPPIRPWLLNLCRHEIRMRCESAAQHLEWSSMPLDLGLRATAVWFLAGGRT